MKIFVTGATGYIGKNLLKELFAEGHDVSVSLRAGKESPFESQIQTFNIDEENIERTIDFFKQEKFDGVIHLASLYIKQHTSEEVFELINSNVRFSTHVLESAAKADIPWFINTGTFWQNFENKHYSPVNLYAATKQAFESIAQFYIETDQVKFVTLRLSDTYGPNDPRPKILNRLNQIAESGEELGMSGGEQIMDICFIDDVASAFIQLAKNLEIDSDLISNGEVYGVSADVRLSLRELVSLFQDVTGKQLKINWGFYPYKDREVMVPWDNSKNVSKWSPKVDLREGLRLLFKNKD